MKPPQSNEELMEIVARRQGYLGLGAFDDRVIEAMKKLDRAWFLPGNPVEEIYEDEPARIGANQTCSQPSMVAAMATMLELRPGMKVLEIGTGCGYSAAVTSLLVAPGGKLYTVEIESELVECARESISGIDILPGNIEIIEGDGSEGLKEYAPYDRIYLTAGAGRYFNEEPILNQLDMGGVFLYPEAFGSMFKLKKLPVGVQRKEMKGVGFVYLRGKNSGYK